jgi:hypothetical protein
VSRYPVRTSHRVNLSPEGLEGLCRSIFEEASRDGPKVHAKFGAIDEIQVWGDARELVVEMRMNPQVPPDVQQETVRRYNRFLEETTGYSSKERAKRLRKQGTAEPGA